MLDDMFGDLNIQLLLYCWLEVVNIDVVSCLDACTIILAWITLVFSGEKTFWSIRTERNIYVVKRFGYLPKHHAVSLQERIAWLSELSRPFWCSGVECGASHVKRPFALTKNAGATFHQTTQKSTARFGSIAIVMGVTITAPREIFALGNS